MSARKLTPQELRELSFDELIDRMTSFVGRCRICGRLSEEDPCERCQGSEEDKRERTEQ